MTTASARKTSSVLPLIIMAAIAVAGWVSYFFAQQEATLSQPKTELPTSELNTKKELRKETLPTKPPEKPKQVATTAPANTSHKEAPEPPKRYNKLLMAERKKALKERDAAQTRIGTILKEKHTIINQKKSALKEGQQLKQQLVLSAENVERLKQKIREVSTDVQKVREQEADRFSKLKQQFEQELEHKQITISQLKNRMTVINVTAEILFGSGSATIKPKGERVLELIAESLNKHPDRMISIEGHTDALPVAWDSQYPTNWELSSARAASAARYLGNRSGVAADRMQVVGHAEHRPAAPNETAEGRATNRRIEIILLPADTL
ncbi:MAG: OmpA family protein [Gammaproteobacteria bacterium]|nr:OmpA family protein [Gammaproteobacteria bacterium]